MSLLRYVYLILSLALYPYPYPYPSPDPTARLYFNDPLPTGAILLTVSVEVFGGALYASSSGNISATLTGLNIGSAVGGWPQGFCTGSGFLSNNQYARLFPSFLYMLTRYRVRSIYQNGWPQYVYGGSNSIVMYATSGSRDCVGTVLLQLYYYIN